MCGVRRIASCYLLVLAIVATTDNRSCAQEKAELVLRNGNVVTVDPNKPAASAVACGSGKILAVGSDEETARKLLGHSHISVTRRYLGERFLPSVSARAVVPPLRPTDPGPPAPEPTGDEPTIQIYRPEAG